jgi:hypothetical protein
MKLLYKPFGILVGIVAGVLARRLFTVIWSKIDEEEPPAPTTRFASWPKVVGAAALRGAVFSGTRVGVQRAGARTFEHLFGIWPGERVPERD